MLFEWLTKLRILRPVENLLVRFAGYSIVSRHVTTQAGVAYVPTLLLTTVGRRSGELRTVPLFYFRDGANYLLIGSKGGAPAHPDWYPNLIESPRAWIRVNRKRIPVTARVAEGEERSRLWEIAAEDWPAYNEYQERAQPREIPVVVLEPAR